MKKLVAILACSALVLSLLSACGATDNTANNTDKTEEQSQGVDASVENGQDTQEVDITEEENNEEYVFDGKVLTVNKDDDDYYMKYVLTITDYKVINPGEEGNEYGESPVIAFWYETAFEKGIEEMTAYLSWAWVLNAIQDNNDSVVNELELTSNPDSELEETEWERIKDGATVRGAVAYKLEDTTTPVQIVGEMNGREVGRGVFDIESISKEKPSVSSAGETITYTISAVDGLAGTWDTATQGYEYYDTPQSEYYVRFTDSEVVYGHMKGEEFVFDHANKIVDLKEMAEGRYIVKIESSNGGQYTYQTSENDNNYLLYFDTWNEDELHDWFSGGSSIGRISSEPSAGETITIPLPVTAGLAGTWETASQGYEYNGTVQAEYYVRFKDWEIKYFHKDGDELIFNHSDKIFSVEKTTEGRYTIKAESSKGVQYTYQTSENDNNFLYFYETWNEDNFQEKYSGGSSLGRID